MRIGVLGTGMVGKAIASRLVEVGHEVRLGSRTSDNENLLNWVEENGESASGGTFADAAAFGSVVVNATRGIISLDVLEAAGEENLAGKTVMDVANPLVITSEVEPPSLGILNDDSLGERIQRRFPTARVVKTLNTMNCDIMVNPKVLSGHHNVFVSGNDKAAKDEVASLLGQFGWGEDTIFDLGDITTARGPEMFVALYSRMFLKIRHLHFNISVVWDPNVEPLLPEGV
ncbi:NADPH-dependent F420 reductase [Streptomyces sp. 142MFCol3.1]|uniref:NADPH-dependent F420 reductase n=1 Tax=Streptomyces sp. 142MFCol3.1 TaxID=1172179 RepID=UPI0003FC006E|nr:NAD(P)-binding domain-containing protein [Streptomyces sp. 142MFCol3.1]